MKFDLILLQRSGGGYGTKSDFVPRGFNNRTFFFFILNLTSVFIFVPGRFHSRAFFFFIASFHAFLYLHQIRLWDLTIGLSFSLSLTSHRSISLSLSQGDFTTGPFSSFFLFYACFYLHQIRLCPTGI